MNSFAISRNPKNLPRLAWLGGLLLAAAFVYLWILPLFRPRGDFLWGHYRIKDIYLGIPIALSTLCASLVLVVPARSRRSVSLRLVTLFIAVLGTLVVCDAFYAFGVMRAWRANFWLDQSHISRRYSDPDNELGFVRKPGIFWRGHIEEVNRTVEYRTDENGFRNSSAGRQADVVFIGDSFTEGAQVAEDDTFVKRVGGSSGLRTVNLGRGAYGPQQELIVLQRYGLAYKPRVVVWQLFEGNDLTDAAQFAQWASNPQQVNTSLKQRYIDNSLLTQVLASTRLSNRDLPRVTLRHVDGTATRINLRYRYEPSQPSTLKAGMEETIRALDAGNLLCQSHGIQLLVLVVPTMVRVMEPNISFDTEEDRMTYLPPKIGDVQKDFSGRIEDFCAQVGCGFVDSAKAMQQAAANGSRTLYITNDEHLDVGGHEVINQMVMNWMRSRNVTSAPAGAATK